MHICGDEIMATLAAAPFIGYFCLRCRMICTKCVHWLRRLMGRSQCVHHNHGGE